MCELLGLLILLLAPLAAAQPLEPTLRQFIEKRLGKATNSGQAFKFPELCPVELNSVAARVFKEYGSAFAASDEVILPAKCIFPSEEEVTKFQGSMTKKRARIGSYEIELQEDAMDSLLDAVEQAEEQGLRITPLDGAVAGARSFADTVRIWNSRFIPALNHWVARGRIKREDAEAALKLPVIEQTMHVLAWESQGLYFSTSRNRPIMLSVAPPGTSQHLSLLAFDIEQAENPRVREILNRNGWYQTIVGDSSHFTYLGVSESKLPERGLKKVFSGAHGFWVPRLAAESPAPATLVRPN